MRYTTINDLFAAYSEGCGSEGPVLTRDALQDDFRDWCRARGVASRYEEQGEAYLSAADGPYSEAATSDDARDDVDGEVLAREVEVRVTGVTAEESADDEGSAYWVEARVEGLGHELRGVRLYACPHPDGRPGLEPCGDSLDCWMDSELSRIYGDAIAREVGRRVISLARV